MYLFSHAVVKCDCNLLFIFICLEEEAYEGNNTQIPQYLLFSKPGLVTGSFEKHRKLVVADICTLIFTQMSARYWEDYKYASGQSRPHKY